MTNQITAALPAFSAAEREQQRIAHLVLGAPRPRRKLTSKRKKTKPPIVLLAPGIEERVRLREDWSHKQGTPETHAKHAAAQAHDGALGRLLRNGAIDAHQAAAAELIVAAHERITADVAVRTAKLEPRGSGGGANAASAERIAAVILERRYTEWRDSVGPFAAMMLAIIVDGMALSAAARRWRMSDRRARALLVDALNQWGRGR